MSCFKNNGIFLEEDRYKDPMIILRNIELYGYIQCAITYFQQFFKKNKISFANNLLRLIFVILKLMR